jgi:hypothetical protein
MFMLNKKQLKFTIFIFILSLIGIGFYASIKISERNHLKLCTTTHDVNIIISCSYGLPHSITAQQNYDMFYNNAKNYDSYHNDLYALGFKSAYSYCEGNYRECNLHDKNVFQIVIHKCAMNGELSCSQTFLTENDKKSITNEQLTIFSNTIENGIRNKYIFPCGYPLLQTFFNKLSLEEQQNLNPDIYRVCKNQSEH